MLSEIVEAGPDLMGFETARGGTFIKRTAAAVRDDSSGTGGQGGRLVHCARMAVQVAVQTVSVGVARAREDGACERIVDDVLVQDGRGIQDDASRRLRQRGGEARFGGVQYGAGGGCDAGGGCWIGGG